jgi:hypothetical protein
VIFCERDGVERQCTVVTELSGPLKGCRVVRGREEECRPHYGHEKEKESVWATQWQPDRSA